MRREYLVEEITDHFIRVTAYDYKGFKEYPSGQRKISRKLIKKRDLKILEVGQILHKKLRKLGITQRYWKTSDISKASMMAEKMLDLFANREG